MKKNDITLCTLVSFSGVSYADTDMFMLFSQMSTSEAGYAERKISQSPLQREFQQIKKGRKYYLREQRSEKQEVEEWA